MTTTTALGRAIQRDRTTHKDKHTGQKPESRHNQAARFGFLTEGALRHVENLHRIVPESKVPKYAKALRMPAGDVLRMVRRHNAAVLCERSAP